MFLLRCGLYALRQKKRQLSQARSLDPGRDQEKLQAWIQQLPFKLTGAQERVWSDIEADLRAQEPMNRLLQGDVGSGKTVVAALAMLQCALAGGQAVLMAPTSILAVQHHKTLTGLLAGSGFEPALLTGASRPAQRRLLLEALASGQQRLLVGTHALIEQAVRFQNLALAITDEQHRFGVRQRKQLAARKEQTDLAPHVLVMSATPIPRSLALILYGDLDLSLLDERPAGRAPVATYTATSQDQARLQDLMARTVSRGEQVYVICPMVEEQEDLDLQAAISRFQDLSQEAAGRWRTGLVHGRMRPEEKEDQMGRFMAGETDVLVSTTVVEVGVDNPRATLMVIENAERFGLAQLHQLRGRVGRSSLPAVCVLVSDSREGLARKRLQVLCKTQDGFAIAEQDLKLRGPGDFFGTRQHGLPDLKLVNLYEDRDLMAAVDRALDQLIDKDPDLRRPEHQALGRQIAARFPDLAQIGL